MARLIRRLTSRRHLPIRSRRFHSVRYSRVSDPIQLAKAGHVKASRDAQVSLARHRALNILLLLLLLLVFFWLLRDPRIILGSGDSVKYDQVS